MGTGGLGERRIVTVLFCDIVESTALGERLGPERFKIVTIIYVRDVALVASHVKDWWATPLAVSRIADLVVEDSSHGTMAAA